MSLAIDLKDYPPEKRAEVYAKAKAGGIAVLNEELAAQAVLDDMAARGLTRPKPLSLDFPGEMPDVRQTPEFFRVSTRKGFDILFDGLPIGPSYAEELEAIAKVRYKDAIEPHVVCHVFAAFAFPIRGGENKYGASIVNPQAMNRVLPMKLREHLKIEAYYAEKGQRADAIWYIMRVVADKGELGAFHREMREIALEAQTQCSVGYIGNWS